MPTTNFKYEKRQKDIQKKKKRDEKIQRRQATKKQAEAEPVSETPVAPVEQDKKEETPGG